MGHKIKDTACLMPGSDVSCCVTSCHFLISVWPTDQELDKKCKLWSKTNGRKTSLNDGVANCNVLFPSSINQQSDLLVIQGDTALPSKAKLILSACFKKCSKILKHTKGYSNLVHFLYHPLKYIRRVQVDKILQGPAEYCHPYIQSG